ncbi:Di-sulfide bridge nucleocytoplasmic transport domain-containing protein [Hygrophoropsis aurantiaca]|uniref:Di-sulfide bridge nucleocytoplasmic transport domain-containing protein n=1 Tax=Hygrophoropsis aurantiaca TaxID=72124 RepID=A0ACB8A4B0_9AGAM|nr:Di-sulfide bridge nucleocytoplasmic transport domain-containing protein [Hygrophoropsis aurantiaca]
MNPRLHSHRSSEAPMDFEFTSRPSSHTKSVWATADDDPNTPRKRPFNDINPSIPTFPAPANTPIFGENRNVPFIFQQPAPQTPSPYPWAPPPHFSPQKAFPNPPQEEVRDVDMSELSPPKPEEPSPVRAVATGALRRVFNSRRKARVQNRLTSSRQDDPGYGSEGESEDEEGNHGQLTHNTSNHYTLNLPSAPTPQSDTPYILLGYLQFFFNLSLVLVFLYLLLQFILTVQRDVEHRISEYSMDIVQEIAMCAAQYKNNLCATNPIPAMAQQCATWETCMNRDPTTVGRARVGAELIAEVVNGFVEPISWKTLAFSLTSLSFLTVFINTLLSLYRSRHHAVHPQHQYPVPPVAPFQQYLPSGPASRNHSWFGSTEEPTEDAHRRRRLEGGQSVKVK